MEWAEQPSGGDPVGHCARPVLVLPRLRRLPRNPVIQEDYSDGVYTGTHPQVVVAWWQNWFCTEKLYCSRKRICCLFYLLVSFTFLTFHYVSTTGITKWNRRGRRAFRYLQVWQQWRTFANLSSAGKYFYHIPVSTLMHTPVQLFCVLTGFTSVLHHHLHLRLRFVTNITIWIKIEFWLISVINNNEN